MNQQNEQTDNDRRLLLPPSPVGPAVDLAVGERISNSNAADLELYQRTEGVLQGVAWSDYEEPELISLRRAARAVLLSRVALAAWALLLVVAAAVLRGRISEGSVSTTIISRVALSGVLVGAGAAAVGWYWSDRATQDVHRLAGRLPGRIRCASAWAWPLTWFAVLSVTLLRLEPSEPIDIRPSLIAVVFCLALWRPYSLVRRILRSLIRIDSDLALGAGYLLDVACIGLLWARLADLPDDMGTADRGVAGVVLGLSAVAALAAIGNIGVWFVLTRDVDRAVEHRRVALRTRHQHRQLRLRGIDPLDPHVRYALFVIQQEALKVDAEREEALGDEDPTSAVEADMSEGDGAASCVDSHVVRPPEQIGGLVDDPESSSAAGSTSIGKAVPDAEPVGTDEPVEAVGSGEAVSDAEPVGVDDPVGVDEPLDVAAYGEGTDSDAAPAGEDEPLEVVTHGEGAVPDAEPVDTRQSNDDSAPSDLVDRVAARLARRRPAQRPNVDARGKIFRRFESAGPVDDLESARDPVARVRGHFAVEPLIVDEASIFDRLGRFGIVPGEAIPDDGLGLHVMADQDPLVIEKVYSLELVRYLLILAMGVCGGASVSFVAASIEVGELVSGDIGPAGLDRLELARLTTARSLAVATSLVPLWCAVAARWANRVGLDIDGFGRCASLTAVSAVLVATGYVTDPATNAATFLLTGGLGAALWSMPVMFEIVRRFERDTTIVSLLPLVLSLCVLTALTGGLLTSVKATDSLEAMSFSGGLFALLAAIAVVVMFVSTGDVVEAVRLSGPRRDQTDGGITENVTTCQ